MQIEMDNGSGFCFGVTTAIKKAEEELAKKNEADILVGNNKKKDIAQILEEYFAAKEPEQEVPVVSEVIDINHTKEYEDLTIHKVNEHT